NLGQRELGLPRSDQIDHLRQRRDLFVLLVRQVQLEAVIDVDSDLEQRQGVEVQVVAQGVLVADPLALEPRDAGDDVLDLFANLGAFHVDSSREVKLGWAILNLSGGVRAPPQNAQMQCFQRSCPLPLPFVPIRLGTAAQRYRRDERRPREAPGKASASEIPSTGE